MLLGTCGWGEFSLLRRQNTLIKAIPILDNLFCHTNIHRKDSKPLPDLRSVFGFLLYCPGGVLVPMPAFGFAGVPQRGRCLRRSDIVCPMLEVAC